MDLTLCVSDSGVKATGKVVTMQQIIITIFSRPPRAARQVLCAATCLSTRGFFISCAAFVRSM